MSKKNLLHLTPGRKHIYIALLLLLSKPGFSQTKGLPFFDYNGTEFSAPVNKYIAENERVSVYISNHLYKHSRHLYDSFCNKGVAILRFKVDSAARITNIACSRVTPSELAAAFKKALRASEKYWKPGARKKETWFLQPILYDYKARCKNVNNEFFSMTGGSFDFGDNVKIVQFECVMLYPLTIFSGVPD